MTAPGERRWPRKFKDGRVGGYTVRELIIGRDTPLGLNRPRCGWCGRLIQGRPDVHHLLFSGQLGDGRPSNGISLCPPGSGGCHALLHDRHPALAQARGLQRHAGWAVPGAYAAPVRCAWRGWSVFDDAGGTRPAGRDEVAALFGAPAWDDDPRCPRCGGWCTNGAECAVSQFVGREQDWRLPGAPREA